jgi:flagella basal body P-ring formation protein FlgA
MITLLAFLALLDGPRLEVTVTLRAEAHVTGTEVELGEIASVTAADPVRVAQLEAFELGGAPAPGYSRLFVAERVQEELERRLALSGLRMAGERACRVFPAVEQLPADEIEAAARAELARVFAGRDVRYELRGEVPRVDLPVGKQGRLVRALPVELPSASGTLSVPVEVLVDGVRYRTVWLSFEFGLYETRAVLSRAVRAGEAFAPDAFSIARVRLRGGAGDALPPERLVGAVAVRDLAPGSDVTDKDVLRPQVLAPGETVFLCVRKGAVEARVAAVTVEGGSIGDRIRVRAAGATQELLAAVRSRDLCEIDLTR